MSMEKITTPYAAAVNRLRALLSASKPAAIDKEAGAERALTETIKQRDYMEEVGTKLAEKVGEYLGVDIGEWSSANDPIVAAIEALDEAAPLDKGASKPAAPTDAERMMKLCTLLDRMDDEGKGFPSVIHDAFQQGGAATRAALDAYEVDGFAPAAPSADTQDELGALDNLRDKWKIVDGDCRKGANGLITYHVDAFDEGYCAALQSPSQPTDAAAPAKLGEAVISDELHPDTAKLVRRFARALGNKLLAAQRKYGYSANWMRDDWADECRAELMRYIQKGDPRDVAAYCAFMWHHDWSTATHCNLCEQTYDPACQECHTSDMATRLVEQNATIRDLQKALSYWMPNVFDDRSAHDAYLLVGYQGEDEESWGEKMQARAASQQPTNGIPATLRHDEGAIARCSYCGRYSLDRKTLSDRQPTCECGEKHGWSGSFVGPGPDAKWSGEAPQSTATQPAQTAPSAVVLDDERAATLYRFLEAPEHILAGDEIWSHRGSEWRAVSPDFIDTKYSDWIPPIRRAASPQATATTGEPVDDAIGFRNQIAAICARMAFFKV